MVYGTFCSIPKSHIFFDQTDTFCVADGNVLTLPLPRSSSPPPPLPLSGSGRDQRVPVTLLQPPGVGRALRRDVLGRGHRGLPRRGQRQPAAAVAPERVPSVFGRRGR